MRTPQEIREDLRVLDRKFKRQSETLESELAQVKTGFEVGDTIQARQVEGMSIVITEVTDKAINGTLTNTAFTMPIREARSWHKV